MAPSRRDRDGLGTVYDMSNKLSTGTEEHKKAELAAQPPAVIEAKQSVADIPPPPPEPVARPTEEPTKPQTALEEQYVPVDVPKAGADYLWLGLGALFLLVAIGIIVFILMA